MGDTESDPRDLLGDTHQVEELDLAVHVIADERKPPDCLHELDTERPLDAIPDPLLCLGAITYSVVRVISHSHDVSLTLPLLQGRVSKCSGLERRKEPNFN